MRDGKVMRRTYEVVEYFQMGGVRVGALWTIIMGEEGPASAKLTLMVDPPAHNDIRAGESRAVPPSDVPRHVLDDIMGATAYDHLKIEKHLERDGARQSVIDRAVSEAEDAE